MDIDNSSNHESEDKSIKYYKLTQSDIDDYEKLLSVEKSEKSEFWYKKYEENAKKNWDIFYKENKDKFFQDRHYLHKELPELESAENFLELGCGVGNTLFPVKEQFPSIQVYGVDFSKRAIDIIRSANKEITVSVADIVHDSIPEEWGKFSIVTLIFVLSAISPENHSKVVLKIKNLLKPNGILYFRDYAVYDLAQIRFSSKGGSKLKENFYVRGDGTRSYFFHKNEIKNLFESSGLKEIENDFHCRLIENKKSNVQMKRVWIQAKFKLEN